MTPHPLSVVYRHARGNCMAPVWNDGDPCWIAWYGVSWEEIAALHGKVCAYILPTENGLECWAGILDHVEMTMPSTEQVLVIRTINPVPHQTITRVPLSLIQAIGEIYHADDRHLIPEPMEPEPLPEIVEVEIQEVPARKKQPVFEAVPVERVSRNRINAKIN